MITQKTAQELAYLYDLFIVPTWREVFDRIVDDEIKLPEKCRTLDAGCGTGGYAVALAARLGADSHVTGVDASPEKLEIARGKAELQKMKQISFAEGTIELTGQPDNQFDLVIGDAAMHDPQRMEAVFSELARVAKPGATVAVKLTTRGSFDEFFSLYWQALYELDLTDLTPQLEQLINERLLIDDAEVLAQQAGLKHVRHITRKERFDYDNAATFLADPLIETSFLEDWLFIVPAADRERMRQKLIAVIDEERGGYAFDVSIKATLIVGEK